MSGEFITHDEWFVHEGTRYPFMLAKPGTLANVSSSPFAPKSTTGDRSYADYDAIAMLAMADFAGGMGQERLTDPTMFYDSQDVDTRGGRITLGPKVTATSPASPHTFTPTGYIAIYNGRPGVAQKFSTPSGMTKMRMVWLYLLGDRGINEFSVKVYDNNAGLPGNVLGSVTFSAGALRPRGRWFAAAFAAPLDVTPNVTYWLSVESVSTSKVWWAIESAEGATEAAYWSVGGWTVYNDVRLAHFAADYQDVPATPTAPFIGAGRDNIMRVWARGGANLYYIGNDGAPVAVASAAGGAVKLLSADIACHAWYRGPSDTHAYLYLGLGDSTPIARFDGYIGDETWTDMTTPANHYASALCVHDDLLVYGYNRNEVDCYNGSTWGSASVKVGDRTYQIRSMVSWNGTVWVGKDDGLYKITVPAGYPTTGSLACQKIVDFLPLADDNNFAFMVVHLGDLYFPIGNGIMRYTVGNVLQAISPDTGLNVSASTRLNYRAAVSTINTLYVLGEGSTISKYLGSPYDTWRITHIGASELLAYAEGHWHPLAVFDDGLESLQARGMCIEPGWYGDQPRLWFNVGMRIHYLEMPTHTARRWLVPDVEYTDEGYLITSWFDGNIRTIEKDWITAYVSMHDTSNSTGSGTVALYWRENENAAWEQVGTTQAAGEELAEFTFPAGSHSHKCQLKIVLTRGSEADTTPTVEAIVVKYMERPEDVRSFTRAFQLADRQENRNGVLFTRNLAQQLDDLRTLREAKEPITHHAWYGRERTVHIVDYSISEMPDEQSEAGDKGVMLAVVRLQEV